MIANTGVYADPQVAVELATTAEEVGIDSLWTADHVVIANEYASKYPYSEDGKLPAGEDWDLPDPLIWCSYVAAMTSTIKLATGVVILPERNPVVLAKQCATLAQLSGGRFELGVGVGWLAEEFDIVGVPWERRGVRTNDYIGAMRALWSQDVASFSSEFVNFEGAVCRPQPPAGSVPIVIGGHSTAAAKRAGRLGDGFFPGGTDTYDDLRAIIDIMRDAATEAGRDPDAIEISSPSWSPKRGTADQLSELADMGVTRLIVAPPTSNPDHLSDAVRALGDSIAPYI